MKWISITAIAGLLIACFLSSCAETPSQSFPTNTSPVQVKDQSIEILGEMYWLPNHLKPGQFVFPNEKQLRDVWLADGGTDKIPLQWIPKNAARGLADAKPIDFDKQMVIAVFRGAATDHDSIQIERIVKGDSKITVEYRNARINKGTAPKPAYPSHIVVINKIEGTVEFIVLPPAPLSPAPVP